MRNDIAVRSTRRAQFVVGVIATALVVVVGGAGPSYAEAGATPDVAAAVHYLTATTGANGVAGGTSLAHDGYYESFADFADYGLTIDGALALAATRLDNATLTKVVEFLDQSKRDRSGQSVNDWTGIGTEFATGGAIGKEALLAEVTGFDPRDFGGHDLVSALDHVVCTATDVANGCAGPGNYLYAASTFSQALGVIAQLRAGDATSAAPAVAYLESLQNGAGAWPSLLPTTGDSDVDSTAMAAMALALLPGDATASAAVTKANAWIAGRQGADGGFAGVTGDSTNSAALAIQAMTLARSTYATRITDAVTFLARRQNPDGGFDATAGDQQGSDVRASAQAVGAVGGISFGTLSDVIAPDSGGGTTTTMEPASSTTTTTDETTTTTPAAATAAGDATTTGPVARAPRAGALASGPVPATLPATGASTARSLEWVSVLLMLGIAASLARRRRTRA
jgi:LPXTG-motif cell wall-anchored protein